jgi:hypothetical protein
MHHVFRADQSPSGPSSEGIDDLRLFLRSLGLTEQERAGSFLYTCVHASGAVRHFATLHGRHRTATIYLYPDALGRASGHATRFYRELDDAGLGMGSKAGPSIGIDLDDPVQVRLFHDGLAALLGDDSPHPQPPLPCPP